MSRPRFSIIIPTRDHHDTLGASLDSALAQTGDDIEIIIADNASSPATNDVIHARSDSRMRVTRSDTRLSMRDNWERGLSFARGEYVTILGDDDALLPTAIDVVRTLIARGARIVSWRRASYFWPSFYAPWLRNRLELPADHRRAVHIERSRDMLLAFYRMRISWERLPMIYNSFIHESVVEDVRRENGGRYFATWCPDIGSGVLNAAATRDFMFCMRPLSIAGTSSHSIGASFGFASQGDAERKRFVAEYKDENVTFVHSRLVPSHNLEIVVGASLLSLEETRFASDPDVRLDVKELVHVAAAHIARDPQSYDEMRSDVLALAYKVGVAERDILFPPRPMRDRDPPTGLARGGLFRGRTLWIDGEAAGLTTVAHAARLADALLPPPLLDGRERLSEATAADLFGGAVDWMRRKLPAPMLRALRRGVRRWRA